MFAFLLWCGLSISPVLAMEQEIEPKIEPDQESVLNQPEENHLSIATIPSPLAEEQDSPPRLTHSRYGEYLKEFNSIRMIGFESERHLRSFYKHQEELKNHTPKSIYPLDLHQNTMVTHLTFIGQNLMEQVSSGTVSHKEALKCAGLLSELKKAIHGNNNFVLFNHENRCFCDLELLYDTDISFLTFFIKAAMAYLPVVKTKKSKLMAECKPERKTTIDVNKINRSAVLQLQEREFEQRFKAFCSLAALKISTLEDN